MVEYEPFAKQYFPDDDTGEIKRKGSAKPRPRRRLRFAVFAVIPVLLLVLTGELVLRLTGLDHPSMKVPGFEEDIYVHDDETFFKNAPNQDVNFGGFSFSTNQFGLRNPVIEEKGENEFRILSLGESSTFGIGVNDDETYSSRLERLLEKANPDRRYTVLNAGVVGWSSFQSLKYLESSGLAFQPDLVLFYHEINDMLPTAIQDKQGNALSDSEYHESPGRYRETGLSSVSAISRCAKLLNNRSASQVHWRMQGGNSAGNSAPLTFTALRANDSKPRVSAQERVDVVERLYELCDQNDIQLVVIHPSYRQSVRHDCELTNTCTKLGIPVFEAYDVLHPREEAATEPLFIDRMHPSSTGHVKLAEGLFEFLANDELLLKESGRE